jgi:hypothetical protein
MRLVNKDNVRKEKTVYLDDIWHITEIKERRRFSLLGMCFATKWHTKHKFAKNSIFTTASNGNIPGTDKKEIVKVGGFHQLINEDKRQDNT